MSPHVYITRRQTRDGVSHVVRYRWGGRGFKLVHLGSKRTLREARALRDWAAGELAAARDPRAELHRAALSASAAVRSMDLDAWWERFIAARLDTAEGTRANFRKAAARFSPLLGSRDPFALTIADVQEAVGALANGDRADDAAQVREFAAAGARLRRGRAERRARPASETSVRPCVMNQSRPMRRTLSRWLEKLTKPMVARVRNDGPNRNARWRDRI